ncbi:MAG: hypothetical protein LUG60_00930 [Erysipelotrichaceae bacterium]|nr:hypothetical protein [Erysipelotrichaceae bacterium]MCD7951143.1 hypothetical protein [Erysipelotrichaceae bacterium]
MNKDIKSFRASENFIKKLEIIETIKKDNNESIKKTELFDEMIDLYYVHLISDNDVLAQQIHVLCANLLAQSNYQNGIFHNTILEEIHKMMDK